MEVVTVEVIVVVVYSGYSYLCLISSAISETNHLNKPHL